MNIQIVINGRNLRIRKGDFLLDICRDNGIRVPTLCSMTDFPPTGACRLCVVEIDGYEDLVPACSFPVNQEIAVRTHSARVIQARKTIVELLLSSHPDDCMYCLRSSACELQSLAVELSVNERKIRPTVTPKQTDTSSEALTHHPGKCILCGRCIRVCDQMQVSALEFVNRGAKMEVGTVAGKGLNNSSCISCGQCIKVCPTGALQEQNEVEKLLSFIQDTDENVVALLDPASASAVAETMGLRSGKDISGLLHSALKTIGFNSVYSGSEAVELSLVQTIQAWEKIVGSGELSWYMTSTCPAWTHYIEQIKPQWIKHLLPANSPLLSFARTFRKIEKNNSDKKLRRSKIVYFTSCVASKTELYRPNRMDKDLPVADLVLTTKELVQLLRLFGIHLDGLDPIAPDRLIKGLPNSSHISSVSGGFLESLYRLYKVLGKAEESSNIEKLRGPKIIKQVEVTINQKPQTWIASSSISEAVKRISLIERGSGHPTLIEVMTCPSGCISGGGQPQSNYEKSKKSRLKYIYDLDRVQTLMNFETYQEYKKAIEKLEEVKFTFREVFV